MLLKKKMDILLLIVFGEPINNAKCWFKIPGIGTVQPSEFIKIILIVYLASFITKYRKKHPKRTLKHEFIMLLKVLLIVAIPSILTFLEPDTGAVFMYLILTIVILFISEIRYRWFIIGYIFLFINQFYLMTYRFFMYRFKYSF